MHLDSGNIDVRVIATWKLERFEGEAVLAGSNPRFVVALMLASSKEIYELPNSNVGFTSYKIAFFAIDSIVKLFMEADVEGKDYKLIVASEIYHGKKIYYLQRARE